MAQGFRTGGLIVGGPAFITVHISVQLAEMFADALLAGNRSAFLRSHDLGTKTVQVGRKLFESSAKRILLREFGGARHSSIAHSLNGGHCIAHVAELFV